MRCNTRAGHETVFELSVCVLSEFNPVQQPLLNEKVLRDKRKKLRETFERIVRLYERENPETYKELRKLEVDYETKRGQLSLYFDSVKVCVCVLSVVVCEECVSYLYVMLFLIFSSGEDLQMFHTLVLL